MGDRRGLWRGAGTVKTLVKSARGVQYGEAV
jgi:hypothetical protein